MAKKQSESGDVKKGDKQPETVTVPFSMPEFRYKGVSYVRDLKGNITIPYEAAVSGGFVKQ